MRAYGSVAAGGGLNGSHVPLPTTARTNGQRREMRSPIVLQPLSKAEERALYVTPTPKRPKVKAPKKVRTPSRRRVAITDEELPDLIAAYVGGESLSSLSQRTKHGRDAIVSALRRQGVTIRPRGGSATRITDAETAHIVATYRELQSIAATAEAVRRHTMTVSDVLDRAGITDHHQHRGGPTRVDDDAIVALWGEGLAMNAIAVRLGYSPNGVKCALRRAGVGDTSIRQAKRGADNPTTAMKARLDAAGATVAEVRRWAVIHGGDCPRRGIPPAAIVNDYLTWKEGA